MAITTRNKPEVIRNPAILNLLPDNTKTAFTKEVGNFINKQMPTDTGIDQWELMGKDTKGLPGDAAKAFHKLSKTASDDTPVSAYQFQMKDGVAFAVRSQNIENGADSITIFSRYGKELATGAGRPDGKFSFKLHKSAAE